MRADATFWATVSAAKPAWQFLEGTVMATTARNWPILWPEPIGKAVTASFITGLPQLLFHFLASL